MHEFPIDQRSRLLFGITIHALRMSETVDLVRCWLREPSHYCRYIVTPNVDHIVKLQNCTEMLASYRAASLVIADGWPIVVASRLLRRSLPERVTGSDLIPELLARSSPNNPLRIFLLGAAPGVADAASEYIRRRWPSVEVCGTLSPNFGFELRPADNEEVLATVNEAQPDLLVVGLGAPKQEIWLHSYAHRLKAKVAVAAGGTIDFLAGKQRRAPLWVQRIGMEWLHRVVSNPKRLARRYLNDMIKFPQLVVREFWESNGTTARRSRPIVD